MAPKCHRRNHRLKFRCDSSIFGQQKRHLTRKGELIPFPNEAHRYMIPLRTRNSRIRKYHRHLHTYRRNPLAYVKFNNFCAMLGLRQA